MADQFQIPQRNPPQPTFQPPSDLVNAYLNRPAAAQIASQGLAQAGSQAAAFNQYQLQKYLQQQQLKAAAFEAGGPELLQALYGNPQQRQQPSVVPSSGNMMMSPTAGTPSGPTPSNSGSTPSISAQTMPTGTQPGTGTVGGENPGSSGSSPQANGQTPQTSGGIPETIQASLNMGHPDFTGLLSQAQQYQGMGKYGREMTQNLAAQGQLSMLPMTAAKNEADLRASQAKFATPEQGAAIAGGNPADIAAAYGGQAPVEAYQYAGNKAMEKSKTVAGEVGKLTQQKTEVKTLQGMFDNLDKSLHSYYKDPKSFVGSANIYNATKGRMGSASGADAINQGQPLVAALNQILTKRFNMSESQVLNNALAPSPNDTPQRAASKMRMIHQIIGAMQQGNQDNVTSVLQAINGQYGNLQ